MVSLILCSRFASTHLSRAERCWVSVCHALPGIQSTIPSVVVRLPWRQIVYIDNHAKLHMQSAYKEKDCCYLHIEIHVIMNEMHCSPGHYYIGCCL